MITLLFANHPAVVGFSARLVIRRENHYLLDRKCVPEGLERLSWCIFLLKGILRGMVKGNTTSK